MWVLSYSVIFGVLGGAIFCTALIFVPVQLLCKVFAKKAEEYSWMDRAFTRVMLSWNVILIFPLTVVGLWATSAFYFNVDYPVTQIHDQFWVLRQKYTLYYQNAYLLLENNPPYDIMPAAPIGQLNLVLQNDTSPLTDALTFMDTWVVRGAFGGLIPYTMPLLAVVFSMAYIVQGRWLMYTVALITTLLSLVCLMGVAIPNSAWAVLVSSQCTSGVHTNLMRYLDYYNPTNCVPDMVEAYVWMDQVNRTGCLPEPFSYTQAKLDSVSQSGPSGNAQLYLAAAKSAWTVMADTARTNVLYDRALEKTCGATANRGATLFLATLLLQAYLLIHTYTILFSTWRLKPPKIEAYNKFHDEIGDTKTVDGEIRSNIRERIQKERHFQEIDNSVVLWNSLGFWITHAIVFLLMCIGFGVGAQKVIVVDP